MTCPTCGAQTLPGAKFCTGCGNQLPSITVTDADETLKYIVPINNTAMSIFAFYFSFSSITFVLAPFALLFGVLALRGLKKHPGKAGRGRAWFAIGTGGVFTALLLLFIIISLISAHK